MSTATTLGVARQSSQQWDDWVLRKDGRGEEGDEGVLTASKQSNQRGGGDSFFSSR